MIDEKIISQIKPGAQISVQEKTGTFTGMVIARKHGKESGATFTVRTTLDGVGVEKVYPINCPSIVKIKITSSPKKVHKAKLYFVRKFSKKQTRQRVGTSA